MLSRLSVTERLLKEIFCEIKTSLIPKTKRQKNNSRSTDEVCVAIGRNAHRHLLTTPDRQRCWVAALAAAGLGTEVFGLAGVSPGVQERPGGRGS